MSKLWPAILLVIAAGAIGYTGSGARTRMGTSDPANPSFTTTNSTTVNSTLIDAGTVRADTVKVGTIATANKLTSDDTTLTITGPVTMTGAVACGNFCSASSAFQLGANASIFVEASLGYNTTPTISSGFGTSPSVATHNGTFAFTINVGTGGTASSGVIGLPDVTGAHRWVCKCSDIANAASVAETDQSATSSSSCTVTNVNKTTGVALAWGASTILYCLAGAI